MKTKLGGTIIVSQTIQTLSAVVKRIPLGTNLSLVRLMYVMMQGHFLSSRGSIHSALNEAGCCKEETKRIWSAFAYGQWSITSLISCWRDHVLSEQQWKGHKREGYQGIAGDITSFRRPNLSTWQAKLYQGVFGKALKAVGFGLIAEIASVDKQRFALIKKVLRSKAEQGTEKKLKTSLLKWLAQHLAEKEIALLDAGFKLFELHSSGLKNYIVRQASNCTARRNVLPLYKGRGRKACYGELIRPLARKHKGKTSEACEPDELTIFELEGQSIEVHTWHELVRSDQKPCDEHQTFSLIAFFDPRYKQPLVLASSLRLKPKSVFLFYQDRWPIEQVPLAAKQMLGCKRMFVFNPESIFRLPELALLVGNILTYLAATLATIPSGFWDTNPKKRQAGYAGL